MKTPCIEKMLIALGELRLIETFDQGTARQISINDKFEDVLIEPGIGEVPIACVAFIKEVEPIEPLYSVHLDLHVEVRCISLVIWICSGR